MDSQSLHVSDSHPKGPEHHIDDERGWTPSLAVNMLAILLAGEAVAMGYFMITTSLPFVSAHYQTTHGIWMLTSFLVTGAMFAPLVGKLADMYGKRLLLLISTASGALGFFVSAIAPNYAVMLTGRAMTGLLCSTVFLGYSLIRDVFPKKTVPMAVSIATVGLGVVAVPAPFLTGWLLDNFGFRSIFWFFVALLIFTTALMFTLEETSVRIHSSLDFLGAVLFGCGIAGVLVGVSFGPTWGWTAGSTLSFLVVGIILLAFWIATAMYKKEPLIAMRDLSRRSVFLTTMCAGISYGVTATFAALTPVMVMVPAMMGLGYGWGLSAEDYAFFLLPFVIAVLIGGLSVGRLVMLGVPPRLLMILGLLAITVGFALIAFNHSTRDTVMWLALMVGLGQGLAYATIPNLLIESVTPELQATTAGITTTAQNIFPAIITVVIFTILNNSYVAVVAEGVPFYSSEGFRTVFLVTGAISAVGAGLAYALPKRISDSSRSNVQEADPAMIG